MKRSKIIIVSVLITSLLLIFINTLSSNKVEESIIDSKDKFKADMLESIMEFANDSTPVDSLYIPDWLK